MPGELFKLFGMIGMHGLDDVEANLNKVDKQVRKVQRRIDKFGRGVQDTGKKLTVAFTAPIVAASGAVAFLSGKTGEYADKLRLCGAADGAGG